MKSRPLTDFEQVLLAMLVSEPRSGYDLRKLFTATPASVYQPSAGAMYPALRRLERRDLLRVESATSAGRRPRRVWHPTEAGRAVHLEWVRQPVRPETVATDLGLHLMRFVMMEGQVPAQDVRAFLVSLIDALDTFIGGVKGYVAGEGARLDSRHAVLALCHAIEMHQASLDWARNTLAELSSD